LKETPCDPKTAPTRLITHVEIGEIASVGFGDAANASLQSVLGSGNGAVVARFGFAVTFEDGDDGLFFMDVESEVECLWCV